MHLRDSDKTISFLTRITLQLPTISLAAITMLVISRQLGPSGRAEISQVLLLASLASSIICSPIFLNIMHLNLANEIKTYSIESLYLFRRSNVLTIIFLNLFFLLTNHLENRSFQLGDFLYINSLTFFYLIAAQIRDLLLRFHKNKIYGVDLVTQVMLSTSLLSFLVLQNLSASRVIQIFVTTYAILALFLVALLKKQAPEFQYANLIRRKSQVKMHFKKWRPSDSFASVGVLFQIAMSKDLLLGMLLLSKVNFGLMAAVASFWVVIRFIRPSAVIQVKTNSNDSEVILNKSKSFLFFLRKADSVIYIQLLIIGAVGLVCYLTTPILLGNAFSPSIQIVLAGTLAEILLMKCLYDLSITKSTLPQSLFWYLCILQSISLMILEFIGLNTSIEFIWGSSCVTYLLWLVLNNRIDRR